jgi:hypothetical protein
MLVTRASGITLSGIATVHATCTQAGKPEAQAYRTRCIRATGRTRSCRGPNGPGPRLSQCHQSGCIYITRNCHRRLVCPLGIVGQMQNANLSPGTSSPNLRFKSRMRTVSALRILITDKCTTTKVQEVAAGQRRVPLGSVGCQCRCIAGRALYQIMYQIMSAKTKFTKTN